MTFPAAAFLEAIRAAPDDDAPRLIYADWLDEQGEAAHAQFIRLQIAAANAPPYSLEREVWREREFQFMPSRRIPRDVDNPPTLSVSFQRGLPAIVELDGDAFDGPSAAARWQALSDTGPGLRGVSFRNPQNLLQADWLQRPPPFRIVEFSLDGDLETFAPANVERLAASPWLNEVEHLKLDLPMASEWTPPSLWTPFRPILEALSRRTHCRLRSFELAGSWHIHDPTGRHALSDLRIFDEIETLNISRDWTGLGREALLQSNRFSSLRTLVMHDCSLPFESWTMIPGPILKSLTTLDLGSASTTELADFLPACSEQATSLQCLVIVADRRNRTPPLPTALRWPSLRRLRLDHNRLLAGDVKALAKWPLGANLEELSLESCEIGSVGVNALAASPTLVNLRALNLRDNQFSVQAEMKLRKSKRFPRLRHLLV